MAVVRCVCPLPGKRNLLAALSQEACQVRWSSNESPRGAHFCRKRPDSPENTAKIRCSNRYDLGWESSGRCAVTLADAGPDLLRNGARNVRSKRYDLGFSKSGRCGGSAFAVTAGSALFMGIAPHPSPLPMGEGVPPCPLRRRPSPMGLRYAHIW